jgi:hypothetical protein
VTSIRLSTRNFKGAHIEGHEVLQTKLDKPGKWYGLYLRCNSLNIFLNFRSSEREVFKPRKMIIFSGKYKLIIYNNHRVHKIGVIPDDNSGDEHTKTNVQEKNYLIKPQSYATYFIYILLYCYFKHVSGIMFPSSGLSLYTYVMSQNCTASHFFRAFDSFYYRF